MKKLTCMMLCLCLMLATCAVSAAEQLLVLSATVNAGSTQGYPGQYFALTEDIDLTGVEWQPIGKTETLYESTDQSEEEPAA